MSNEIECMCMQCGISTYLPEGSVIMDDSSDADSKLLDILLVCEQCGGQLTIVGKSGDEPFYRLK
jgi:hypothetical protein